LFITNSFCKPLKDNNSAVPSTKNYIPIETDSFPHPGELCRQCKDKEKEGDCKKQ
jgi:hypothetical protein